MNDALLFADREAFRCWLDENVGGQAVWLLFGKRGGPKTLTAAEALEEALCYGWIDGQMQSLSDVAYKKYFAPRGDKSAWSAKNRALAEKLERDGRMTAHGRARIEQAKSRGTWESPERTGPTDEDVARLIAALAPHEKAHANFMNMTPSVRRTYTGWAMDTKSEEAARKRFGQLVERLELNLNPMQSLQKAKEELGLG